MIQTLLRIRIQVPRIRCLFFTPGSGSGMNIPDHISENLETILWCVSGSGIRNLFDPGSGIREGKKFGSGINIPDPQHWGSYFFVEKDEQKTFLALSHLGSYGKQESCNLRRRKIRRSINVLHITGTWRTPFVRYLKETERFLAHDEVCMWILMAVVLLQALQGFARPALTRSRVENAARQLVLDARRHFGFLRRLSHNCHSCPAEGILCPRGYDVTSFKNYARFLWRDFRDILNFLSHNCHSYPAERILCPRGYDVTSFARHVVITSLPRKTRVSMMTKLFLFPNGLR